MSGGVERLPRVPREMERFGCSDLGASRQLGWRQGRVGEVHGCSCQVELEIIILLSIAIAKLALACLVIRL